MKRILLFSAMGLLLLLLAAPAFAFGTKDVVKMSKQGVPDNIIITKIENSSHVFHLSGDDITALREDGVSDDVIKAMLRTESRDSYDDYPYYSHPYYYYPRSSFSLGLGFGYYGGYRHYYPYYGHYYTRRYTPYAPYSGNFGTTRYRGSVGSRSGWSGSAPHTRTR